MRSIRPPAPVPAPAADALATAPSPHAPDGPPAPDAPDAAALRCYQQTRRSAARGEWTSALHLGAHQVQLVAGTQASLPAVELRMEWGGTHTAQRFFRRALPTPLELESAITVVEDGVHAAHLQLRAQLPAGVVLAPWSADAALHRLATLAGVAPGPQRVLALDALERLFNRLAAVAEGRPASHEGLPEDAVLAATLLVLRELMHHLPFATLTLVHEALGGDFG